jgi:Spy/CpxP family protein refolding chaperone
MDIFTRNKFLVRIIVVLILLNLFSMAFLWWDKKERPEPGDRPPRKGKENSTQVLKDKLGLSRPQEEALLKLREEFNRREQEITGLIRAGRDSMNVLMFRADTDTTFLQHIARRVADNEYKMELLRIEQSQKLKNICTDEQLKEFQHLVNGIRDFFQPQNQPQNQPRKKKANQSPDF